MCSSDLVLHLPKEREKFCKTGDKSDIPVVQMPFINDAHLDVAFRAFSDCVEESIINSLLRAKAIEPDGCGDYAYDLNTFRLTPTK